MRPDIAEGTNLLTERQILMRIWWSVWIFGLLNLAALIALIGVVS